MAEAYDRLIELKKQGALSKDGFSSDGFQVGEVDRRERAESIRLDDIIQRLWEELELDKLVTNNSAPGRKEYMMAKLIGEAKMIVKGEKDFDKSLEDLKGREDGGRVLGEERDKGRRSITRLIGHSY